MKWRSRIIERSRPDHEPKRIAALTELDLLDTPSEKEFDDLVRLASAVCGVPISLVSLVDAHRQWFKASFGIETKETSRDISFCTHANQQSDVFVVEDATQDERFRNNPPVTGDPAIRFYAGIPLRAPNGYAVGTLCVLDRVSRHLTENQKGALTILGAQVEARMHLRLQQKLVARSMIENEKLNVELEATSDLFRRFMNNGPFASYIKDADGKMVYYNRFLAQRFGVTEQAWIGKTDHDLWPLKMADDFRRNDLAVLEGGVPVEVEETSPDNNGDKTYWKSMKFPYQGADGRLMIAGMSMDVTTQMTREAMLQDALRDKSKLAQDLKATNLQLELLATTDSLTALSNSRVFGFRAAIEFSNSKRKRRPLSMLVIDIDNFKLRNDTYGHAAGDAALQTVGKILIDCVRIGDVAARLGGEEFGFLLPDTDASGAIDLAFRVQIALRQEVQSPTPLTVSVGVSSMTEEIYSWELLLRKADDAMYEAKRSGKNRVVHYDSLLTSVIKPPSSTGLRRVVEA